MIDLKRLMKAQVKAATGRQKGSPLYRLEADIVAIIPLGLDYIWVLVLSD